ncbi:MAG: hypothetical protein OXC91_12735 [Rhodobacteraceae bacterium]|nr:hypothetical protein [Paracoccaceae bacterium]
MTETQHAHDTPDRRSTGFRSSKDRSQKETSRSRRQKRWQQVSTDPLPHPETGKLGLDHD